ncbi:DUF448 domain-containing protein [Sulfurimonas sp. SAG-AH-194-I05]|nr:hypothetical protein [Sulfurimonas sp. SAG-AH-194-I05]MDF1874555.1 DUF448 domain-containing protein [Sulfurimonas sp. SAG-AH-194-I05]
MAKKFHLPIRMCVSCRDRHEQKLLVRLQCKEGSLEAFNNNGRSFYICNTCILNEKKIIKSLMRQCRSGNKQKLVSRLKEIITDDRKS